MEIIHTDAREERVKYILIVDKIYRGNLLFRLNLWCQWIKSFKKWSTEYTIKVLHYVELGFSLYQKFTLGFKEFWNFNSQDRVTKTQFLRTKSIQYQADN